MYEMRFIIDIAFEDPNWKTVAIFCFNLEFKFKLSGVWVNGSFVHKLKRWLNDNSSRVSFYPRFLSKRFSSSFFDLSQETPPRFPPNVLFTIYNLHHLIFVKPHSTRILPHNGPPIGKFANVSVEDPSTSTTSQVTVQLSNSPSTDQAKITKKPITVMMNDKIQSEAGWLDRIMKSKRKAGILKALGIQSNTSRVSPAVVCDFEMDVTKSENEVQGVNNMSMISKDAVSLFTYSSLRPSTQEQN